MSKDSSRRRQKVSNQDCKRHSIEASEVCVLSFTVVQQVWMGRGNNMIVKLQYDGCVCHCLATPPTSQDSSSFLNSRMRTHQTFAQADGGEVRKGQINIRRSAEKAVGRNELLTHIGKNTSRPIHSTQRTYTYVNVHQRAWN